MPKASSPLERTITAANGCMEWIGKRDRYGYGRTMMGYKHITTHRKVWIKTYGPIPDGLFVLHKCDNPPCCNPEHLFLGTQKDNCRDREAKGRGGAAKRAARITHCPQGHEYTPENTYVGFSGGYKGRVCRICRKARVNAWYAAHPRKRKRYA